MANWKPKGGELEIQFDPDEERRYKHPRRGALSTFARVAWPKKLRRGRNKNGCFAEVVARAFFEAKGYKVLLSAPEYPDGLDYLRLAKHRAFKRMQRQFPNVDLHALAEKARAAKKRNLMSGGGGDPDLYVYKPGTRKRFFVEVKHRDQLRRNQIVCFRLIERELCPVKLVRIVPRESDSAR